MFQNISPIIYIKKNHSTVHLEIEDQSTYPPPRFYYDVEVKLVSLGDGFVIPESDSPDFELISNKISESFEPVFKMLPGYYHIYLNELRK